MDESTGRRESPVLSFIWRFLATALELLSCCWFFAAQAEIEQQKKIKYRSAEGKLRLSASSNNEGIR
jgi:hypothetical protein